MDGRSRTNSPLRSAPIAASHKFTDASGQKKTSMMIFLMQVGSPQRWFGRA
jgi:hypothetical protein